MKFLIFSMIAIILYFLLFFAKWRKKGWQGFLYTLFYGYVCAIIYLTLLPIPNSWGLEQFDGDYGNFIPFRDLKMGYRGAVKDIILNVVMMLPFGILFPQIRKNRLITTVSAGFLMSVLIECLQLVATVFGSPYHSFDVTDIISNTTGALLGYILFRITTHCIAKDPKNN